MLKNFLNFAKDKKYGGSLSFFPPCLEKFSKPEILFKMLSKSEILLVSLKFL